MLAEVSPTLTDAAILAGAVTTILGCVTVCGRWLMRFPLFSRFVDWVVEGWKRDRGEHFEQMLREHLPAILDETLAFNGTGSFRNDMRVFYEQVNAYMAEQRKDNGA